MKKVLGFFLSDTPFTSFHIAAIAFVVAGLSIVWTASEMGAFAPLMVAFGLYAMFFALLLEGFFWMRVVTRVVLRRWVAL